MAFWHQYLWDYVSSSINKRIPSRIVTLLSVLDSCACTHMHTCTHTHIWEEQISNWDIKDIMIQIELVNR